MEQYISSILNACGYSAMCKPGIQSMAYNERCEERLGSHGQDSIMRDHIILITHYVSSRSFRGFRSGWHYHSCEPVQASRGRREEAREIRYALKSDQEASVNTYFGRRSSDCVKDRVAVHELHLPGRRILNCREIWHHFVLIVSHRIVFSKTQIPRNASLPLLTLLPLAPLLPLTPP